ncbi:response regulator transcription factor [Pseudorhizobium flavum]|uniref:Two-component system OmpR family response regulator n=1 Tax=Pseudorhizobium flavum TaxID=1335061 RepID=A0A7W9Z0X4_9HYPH|nr:response regulator transcription factor [Pseudorhizobium flavum]MBB6182008.1 two-component system OmpR family response regulator [Pseudorhizobium flavum]CAD6606521.1 DNA-binding response regulator [Pseudorhizobium flavum]
MRVLLIEDDAVLGEAVRDYLAATGHAIDWMRTLEQGQGAIDAVDYDILLLDLRLPDGTGLDLLSDLRKDSNLTPVIILTAHDQISDRLEGLNRGADDYLVKPFNLDELSARMQAVARRYAGSAVAAIEVGALSVHLADRNVTLNGKLVDLSSREWAVLARLAARPGAIVSKAQIEEALYAFGSEIESNTVEVYVSRLRKKLGKDAVETVRGIGYRLGR